MNPDLRHLRIISLIPSATEIIHCLGGSGYLVGRSHECDYPVAVQSIPVCTSPNLDPIGSSAEIHDQVEALLQKALSIYSIDLEQIAQLRPTHIVTQAQCEVCAVSFEQVAAAIEEVATCHPQLISLQPNTIEDVWSDIRRVAECLGLSSQTALKFLSDRVKHLMSRVVKPQKTVGCIEWTDPLMAAGNWVPQLVSMAGGKDVLGTAGQHSDWLTWEQLQGADPEVLIAMPCGFGLPETRQAVQTLSQDERWHQLRAVRNGQVFLTDGNQYFNRPGPRLVDSLEILIEILHEAESDRFRYRGLGWQRWTGEI